jgi:hypothetical protein
MCKSVHLIFVSRYFLTNTLMCSLTSFVITLHIKYDLYFTSLTHFVARVCEQVRIEILISGQCESEFATRLVLATSGLIEIRDARQTQTSCFLAAATQLVLYSTASTSWLATDPALTRKSTQSLFHALRDGEKHCISIRLPTTGYAI